MLHKKACDACNIRKVKCDRQEPCSKCVNNNLQCTYLKVHQKSGPRSLRTSLLKVRQIQQAVEFSNSNKPTAGYNGGRIPLKVLRVCVDLYSQQLYGIRPLINKWDLYAQFEADQDNLELYTLMVALCAATLSDLQLEVTDESMGRQPITAAVFAAEAERSRLEFPYRDVVSLNAILTSYFMHMFYGHMPNRSNTAILHIREAITFAQLMGLHNEDDYANYSISEQQLMRKIYYILFMTERYLCINHGLPVMLDPIKLPNVEYDPQPEALSNFLNLVKVFSIPDKRFFEHWYSREKGSPSLLRDVPYTKEWLVQLQGQLEAPLRFMDRNDDIQRVDIVVTQHWIRSLTWKLSIHSGLVPAATGERVMSMTYPIEIAKDLLTGTSYIPTRAFEVHGPGMEVKIFEILNSLTDVVLWMPESSERSIQLSPHDVLKSVIDLFSSVQVKNKRLRNLITEKIKMISTAHLPRPLSPPLLEPVITEEEPTAPISTITTYQEPFVPSLDDQLPNSQISDDIVQSLGFLEELLMTEISH